MKEEIIKVETSLVPNKPAFDEEMFRLLAMMPNYQMTSLRLEKNVTPKELGTTQTLELLP